MERLNEFNMNLWKVQIYLYKPLSDHIGLAIIFFSVICGLLINFFRTKIRNAPVGYIWLLDVVPLLSVHSALAKLPVFHPRLSLMLETVSSIIYGSDCYLNAFSERAGFIPETKADIVYYLYYMPVSELNKWKVCNPPMLYEKTYKVFRMTRYLFGYLDRPVSGIYLVFAIVLMVVFAARYCNKRKKGELFPFFILAFQIGLSLILIMCGKNGDILSIIFLYFSETIFIKSAILYVRNTCGVNNS